MATIIKGLLSQNLPWGLVLVGVFISVTLELCGIRSLSFAVGSYLPIATTAPIFAGGLVRWFVERQTGEKQESEISSGTLFSSGLIAGGSLAGILYAGALRLQRHPGSRRSRPRLDSFHSCTRGPWAWWREDCCLLALAVVLVRAGRKKLG